MNDGSLQTPLLLRFEHRAQLLSALQKEVVGALSQRIMVDNQAGFIVSGGRSPEPLFNALAATQLDWPKVFVTLADERWVETSDASSNERLLHETLLQNRAAQATWVSLKTSAQQPDQAIEEVNTRLDQFPQVAACTLLGMGSDGHTASLFPNTDTLQEGLNPYNANHCVAVHPPSAAHARLSLTYARLLATDLICVLLLGNEKFEAYQLALQPGPVEDMPIRAFLRQQQVPVKVFWAP